MITGVSPSSSLRLLVDLQQVSEMAQTISGCLEPITIAKRITDQLVTVFDCALARIWLVEPDRMALRLVASSGLYTHTDGSFASVAMGAFKVGKIAQNRIPFLSNQLAEEPWVKDRAWAIAQGIIGFAGYPLQVGDRVIGVLAIFSRQPLSPEFLEVLQWLCTIATVGLDAALAHQYQEQSLPIVTTAQSPLSEQLAELLPQTRFTLVGTERLLSTSLHYLLLRTGEILSSIPCSHCRLMYEATQIVLEATLMPLTDRKQHSWIDITFDPLKFALTSLGGKLQIFGKTQTMLQIALTLPYHNQLSTASLLSGREREILLLLAQGHRDREVADQLHISERTVKFHINNAITKLQAQTRYQALYQAIVRGWLE